MVRRGAAVVRRVRQWYGVVRQWFGVVRQWFGVVRLWCGRCGSGVALLILAVGAVPVLVAAALPWPLLPHALRLSPLQKRIINPSVSAPVLVERELQQGVAAHEVGFRALPVAGACHYPAHDVGHVAGGEGKNGVGLALSDERLALAGAH